MLVSTEIFDHPVATSDFRMSWNDLSDSALEYSSFRLMDALKSFPGSNPSSAVLPTMPPTAVGPSVSLDSLALSSISACALDDEEDADFGLLPIGFSSNDILLEFDDRGELMTAETVPAPAPAQPAMPARTESSQPSEYYGCDLFVSWEDELFAAALTLPRFDHEAASPKIPTSPAFTSDSSDSSDSDSDSDSDCDSSSSGSSSSDSSGSDSESESDHATPVRKTPVRRPREPATARPRLPAKPQTPNKAQVFRQTKQAAAYSPMNPLTQTTSPKRRRLGSLPKPPAPRKRVGPSVALTPIMQTMPLTTPLHVAPPPRPQPSSVRIEYHLAGSAHEFSDEVIRTIFQGQQVVTLSKVEDEDDEDVDIL